MSDEEFDDDALAEEFGDCPPQYTEGEVDDGSLPGYPDDPGRFDEPYDDKYVNEQMMREMVRYERIDAPSHTAYFEGGPRHKEVYEVEDHIWRYGEIRILMQDEIEFATINGPIADLNFMIKSRVGTYRATICDITFNDEQPVKVLRWVWQGTDRPHPRAWSRQKKDDMFMSNFPDRLVGQNVVFHGTTAQQLAKAMADLKWVKNNNPSNPADDIIMAMKKFAGITFDAAKSVDMFNKQYEEPYRMEDDDFTIEEDDEAYDDG